MPPASPTIDLRDWGLLVLLSVIWGGSYPVYRHRGQGAFAAGHRHGAGGHCSGGAAAGLGADGGGLPSDRASWIAIAGLSVLNNIIPFILICQRTDDDRQRAGLGHQCDVTTVRDGIDRIGRSGEACCPQGFRNCHRHCRSGRAERRHVAGSRRPEPRHPAVPGAAASYGLGSLWAKKEVERNSSHQRGDRPVAGLSSSHAGGQLYLRRPRDAYSGRRGQLGCVAGSGACSLRRSPTSFSSASSRAPGLPMCCW